MAEVQHRGIVYRVGQELGPHDVKHTYVEEAERYRSPTGKSGRQAVFMCGYCGTEFTSMIGAVKNGRRKSCGCVHNNSQALAVAGNEFATKFKTVEEAKTLLEQWISHMLGGFSVESFEHCDSQTFQRVVKDFPNVFTDLKLHYASAKNKKFWETALIGGMMGQIPNFVAASCIFRLKAKSGWRDTGESDNDDLEPEVVGVTFEVLPAVDEVQVTNAKSK